jgi:hypothetical protein
MTDMRTIPHVGESSSFQSGLDGGVSHVEVVDDLDSLLAPAVAECEGIVDAARQHRRTRGFPRG